MPKCSHRNPIQAFFCVLESVWLKKKILQSHLLLISTEYQCKIFSSFLRIWKGNTTLIINYDISKTLGQARPKIRPQFFFLDQPFKSQILCNSLYIVLFGTLPLKSTALFKRRFFKATDRLCDISTKFGKTTKYKVSLNLLVTEFLLFAF